MKGMSEKEENRGKEDKKKICKNRRPVSLKLTLRPPALHTWPLHSHRDTGRIESLIWRKHQNSSEQHPTQTHTAKMTETQTLLMQRVRSRLIAEHCMMRKELWAFRENKKESESGNKKKVISFESNYFQAGRKQHSRFTV